MTNAGDHGATAVSPTAVPPTTGAPAHTHDQAPISSDPAAIQAAIEERQRRLASTVDELTNRVSPKELARRGAATAQVRARTAAATAQVRARTAATIAQARAREAVTTSDGTLRTERVAAMGAATLVVVGALVWRRSKA